MRRGSEYFQLCGFLAILSAGLILYSQIEAFEWDEGFHLLAAQLIIAGKRPYLDFCFPQTPLNAYWNAAWMRIFGENWRVAHALAALLTSGAAVLTAEFVFIRLPFPRWRLAGALTAALLVGLNFPVVAFGTVGQAYGMCLFLMVASFRLSILAVERNSAWLTAAVGFLAGAAAASSLLTAMVGPVLLVWILLHNRAGSRTIKFAAFVCAAALPFLPVVWLFTQGPHQVFFNLIEYQTRYRRMNWGNATQHDFEVLIAWIDSSQALLLGLLAAAGVLFIAKRSEWDRVQRAEFYLCGWLALATGAELSAAHPTFEWYFLLTVPFLAILAAVGLCATGSRVYDRPLVLLLAVGSVMSLDLGKSLYEDHNTYNWHNMERVAAKVEQVTPRGATLWADELIYFLTRRRPPAGMEFSYSHKLELPDAEAASLHILPGSELNRRVAAGAFSTVGICENTDVIEALDLPRLYAQKAEIADCTVFWDKTSAAK